MTPGPGPAGSDLGRRVARHVRRRSLLPEDSRVVVACSGGIDSVVLLHILRFCGDLPSVSLMAAHVDHGMRPGSGDDALWVRGLCRGWGIPLETVVLATPPTTEAEARTARYTALDRVRTVLGADLVVTAHHADDQAETVLFRILRGSGPRGMQGIRERRAPALVRPLLPFRRAELEGYAAGWRLAHRVDASNDERRWTRNRIRHELLPLAEELVPGSRAALARLAGVMGEREEAWEQIVEAAEAAVLLGASRDRIAVARAPFLAYHSAIRRGLLERWIQALGGSPREAAVRLALDVVASGPSGRRSSLPGGLALIREFDELVLMRPAPPVPERALEIPDPTPGRGFARIGGRDFEVRWGPLASQQTSVERFVTSGLRFPLQIRGWRAGDRIRLSGGARRLKKVLSEARIAAGDRLRTPVLVDADGTVLWIPGVARAEGPERGEAEFLIGVVDADRT